MTRRDPSVNNVLGQPCQQPHRIQHLVADAYATPYIVRRAEKADATPLAGFCCVNPGQKWTKKVQRAIRDVVTEKVRDASPDVTVFVAEEVNIRLIGVICFGPDPEGRGRCDHLGFGGGTRQMHKGHDLLDASPVAVGPVRHS